ncbi:hypothetical protein QO010_001812 [Caulobacter ginsengisoli]|uniref:DUF2059 domain-containing protein n=1 Tax=Caulobacter ginsengisoli TaxID=400775 RepID=A0ABU0IRQ8_9CAUL|nr:DUF2059 domain-containing protein [Caulobacter ginsengisoli]MDQ0464041.1 hypothetical protein [Caulobacter ginsengisoli]
MSRKFITALSAAALLLASPAATLARAAPPAPAPAVAAATDNDPATYARKLELAKRYMKAARLDEILGSSMKTMGSMMAGQMESEYPDMPKGYSKAIMDAMTESTSVMMKKMTERMTPIIAKIYTEDELSKITEFMESPVGQSMLDKTPLMSVEVAKVMPDLLPTFQQDFMTRVCQKIDCNTPEMKRFKPTAS